MFTLPFAYVPSSENAKVSFLLHFLLFRISFFDFCSRFVFLCVRFFQPAGDQGSNWIEGHRHHCCCGCNCQSKSRHEVRHRRFPNFQMASRLTGVSSLILLSLPTCVAVGYQLCLLLFQFLLTPFKMSDSLLLPTCSFPVSRRLSLCFLLLIILILLFHCLLCFFRCFVLLLRLPPSPSCFCFSLANVVVCFTPILIITIHWLFFSLSFVVPLPSASLPFHSFHRMGEDNFTLDCAGHRKSSPLAFILLSCLFLLLFSLALYPLFLGLRITSRFSTPVVANHRPLPSSLNRIVIRTSWRWCECLGWCSERSFCGDALPIRSWWEEEEEKEEREGEDEEEAKREEKHKR